MEEEKPVETPTDISEMVKLVQEMRAENERAEAILKKREELIVNETKLKILGGKTQTVETPVKEESNVEYAKRMLSNRP